MAILKTVSGEQIEVIDGSLLKESAKKIGVTIACGEGFCGTCKVKIVSGGENLEDKTDNEKALGLEDNERCMCQAKIKSGEVVIELE